VVPQAYPCRDGYLYLPVPSCGRHEISSASQRFRDPDGDGPQARGRCWVRCACAPLSFRPPLDPIRSSDRRPPSAGAMNGRAGGAPVRVRPRQIARHRHTAARTHTWTASQARWARPVTRLRAPGATRVRLPPPPQRHWPLAPRRARAQHQNLQPAVRAAAAATAMPCSAGPGHPGAHVTHRQVGGPTATNLPSTPTRGSPRRSRRRQGACTTTALPARPAPAQG